MKSLAHSWLVEVLDRYFSAEVNFSSSSLRTLPIWPRWLCEKLTKHDACLKYADYCQDVSGERCRCGAKDLANAQS